MTMNCLSYLLDPQSMMPGALINISCSCCFQLVMVRSLSRTMSSCFTGSGLPKIFGNEKSIPELAEELESLKTTWLLSPSAGDWATSVTPVKTTPAPRTHEAEGDHGLLPEEWMLGRVV